MKKVLIAFTSVAFFAACNSNPKTGTTETIKNDTTGLAAYNAWKEEQQMINLEGIKEFNGYDGNVYNHNTTTGKTIDNSSGNGTVTKKTTPTVGTSGNQGSGKTTSSTGQTNTPTAKKKGWSKAAQGTAIGAGSGAVIGAVVSKNKAKGAVIGGILGAGGGFAIGRSMDKKDGRY